MQCPGRYCICSPRVPSVRISICHPFLLGLFLLFNLCAFLVFNFMVSGHRGCTPTAISPAQYPLATPPCVTFSTDPWFHTISITCLKECSQKAGGSFATRIPHMSNALVLISFEHKAHNILDHII